VQFRNEKEVKSVAKRERIFKVMELLLKSVEYAVKYNQEDSRTAFTPFLRHK
jgi:hypothetical protein